MKYNITLGKEVHINDITITGNTVSSDRIVRREMIIAPGILIASQPFAKAKTHCAVVAFSDKVNISEIRLDERSMNLTL